MEVHPSPERALSDGPNAWPLQALPELLGVLQQLDQVVKSAHLVEQDLLQASNWGAMNE
jgi:2-dehydro-3-deoxyphosphooctonate aldolase (KDO 8-P synthase)